MKYREKDVGLIMEYKCTYQDHKIYKVISDDIYISNVYSGFNINALWDTNLNPHDRFIIDPSLEDFEPIGSLMETE